MMSVSAFQVVDVQCYQSMINKSMEKLVHQVDVEFTDQPAGVVDRIFETGPPREVDHHARQRFIQRNIGVTIATHAFLVADSFGKGLAERDSDVLDSMVGIDMKIALGLDFKINHTVTRNLVEHVVEESNPGCKPGFAATIQIEANLDLRFEGIAGDLGLAHGRTVSSWPYPNSIRTTRTRATPPLIHC